MTRPSWYASLDTSYRALAADQRACTAQTSQLPDAELNATSAIAVTSVMVTAAGIASLYSVCNLERSMRIWLTDVTTLSSR